MSLTTGLITISDRASRGEYPDRSGPALRQAVEGRGWGVRVETIVPDDKLEIQRAIREQVRQGCQLILTTGGTGLARRDLTPEAVREIADREVPGFGEIIRRESLKISPHAILSRALAATLERTLIICFPGKPSAVVECFTWVADAIPHAVSLLNDDAGHD